MKKLFALILLALAGVAQAQTAPVYSATLSWTAPTTFTDGSPLTAQNTLYYNVFQSDPGGVETKIAGPVASLGYGITAPFTGTKCWTVTAVLWANASESAHSSPPACKTAAVVPPPAKVLNTPTGVAVK